MNKIWMANKGYKPVGEVLEVLFKNGETRITGDVYDWRIPFTQNPELTVVGYRLKEKKVTLTEMMEGIVIDAGGVEVIDADEVLSTNPKKQYGVTSIPLNMWSNLASAYGALGLYNGAGKYGVANYANTPVEASIYIAAIKRHLAAWEAGEEFGPADGVPNLGGVLANVAILLEARAAGTLIDDRPKQFGYLKERDELKKIVKHLNDLHADKNPKHYTIGDMKIEYCKEV